MNILRLKKMLVPTLSLALVLALSCTTLDAQTKFWSLDECVRHALENNIAVKQDEIRRKNAEIDLNTARNSRLPNLSASMGENWNFGRTQTSTGLYENRTQSNTSFSIGGSVPLFTGFRIPNEIERNRFDLLAATENLERARESLALNVASLYYQALYNKELLKLNEEQLNLNRDRLARTRILVEAEKVPASQLSDLEAQTAKDEVTVVQARNNVALSLLDLAQNLELDDATFDIVVPNSDPIPATDPIPSAQLVFENAETIRPVVREREYALESAKRSLLIARADLMPSLNMNFGYGTNYFHIYRNDFANTSLGDQLKNNGAEYIGLTLNIPIFSRFAVRNRIRGAQLAIDNARLALDNARKTLYKEIQTAWLNAVSAREKYRASFKAVDAATVALDYAREKYDAGRATTFEYNESQNRLTQARIERIQAKYDYVFRIKILNFYNEKNYVL